MASYDKSYTTLYRSAIVSIALFTMFELFDVIIVTLKSGL